MKRNGSWLSSLLAGLLLSTPTLADRDPVETITVIADRMHADVPDVHEQIERFLRRPGAETVVDAAELETQRLANLEDLLALTPGIYAMARNQGTGGLFSIRGSDIATAGPRNGRGVRAYIDGIPLGRTEAGLTTALIDLQSSQYTEVYRGPNSLRFGSIATGGALNFVSKTGRSSPDTGIRIGAGSFDHWQLGVEQGWSGEILDAYLSLSGNAAEGFQEQSANSSGHLTSNLGWQIRDGMFSRSYFSVGFSRQELADALPLDQLAERRREPGTIAGIYDQDANFDYLRVGNRLNIDVSESGQVQLDGYFLATGFDHLPTPFVGIVDNTWLEGGLGIRWTDTRQVFSLSTEIVTGVRVNYTDGDFSQYQHRDAGHDKGPKVADQDFSALLVEAYGETAFLLTDTLRLFVGIQAVYTDRELIDNPLEHVDAIPPPPIGYVPSTDLWVPQPGTSDRDASYDQSFSRINPKLGLNREFHPNWFVFASIAQSFEVPTGGDISDIARAQAQVPDAEFPDLKAQRAWTIETGVRGGTERLSMDLTLYHMELRNEILTRCADSELDPGCATTVAFNADETLHQGIEFGGKLVPASDLIVTGDRIVLDATWTYSRFLFQNDPTFGDRPLPVIPRHAVNAALRFEHPSGFFIGTDYQYLSERPVTYDGSGGDDFIVPSTSLWGLRAGWRNPSDRWWLYVQGTNITDEVYVTTFNALPTQPTVIQGPPPARLLLSPNVRPGDGRAWYFGINFRL